MKLYLFLPVSLALTLTSSRSGKLTQQLPNEEQRLELAKKTAESNNAFSADLLDHYLHSTEQKGKNLFFSPFSISSAIGMTAEGAKENTLNEIRKVFHFQDNDSIRQWGFSSLISMINGKHPHYTLNTTNALWIQKGEVLEKDFLHSTKNHYQASAELVDYKADAEKARNTINDFVASKTNNLIKELIAPGIIQPDLTKLILTNTIYFKGDWEQPFDPDRTQPMPFTTSSGEETKLPMMMQTSGFNYFENNQFQVLELPYKDNEISMVVLLPKKERDISNISRKDIDNAFTAQLGRQQVNVWLPKFKFETSYLMKNDLETLGMPLAFTDFADFSGVSKKTPLKISEVIHKAVVEVDELGTEAAAATAVVMVETTSVGPPRPQPKYFHADHPFLFVIRHNATGAILFVGVVNS